MSDAKIKIQKYTLAELMEHRDKKGDLIPITVNPAQHIKNQLHKCRMRATYLMEAGIYSDRQ